MALVERGTGSGSGSVLSRFVLNFYVQLQHLFCVKAFSGTGRKGYW